MKFQKQMMKRLVAVLLTGLVLCAPDAEAQKLPSMAESPWGGFFSGYKRHGFEFGVNDEGMGELYLMTKSRKRVGVSRKVKIVTELIVVSESGKRTVHPIDSDDGFYTEMKPSLKHKEIKYTAKTSSKTQAEIEVYIQYKGNKIVLDAKVVDRGKIKKGDLIVSYKVMVPAMYGSTYKGEDKKSKARMAKDQIKFVRAKDRKSVRLKSYVDVDLSAEDMAAGGVTKLLVKMDAQEGRTFIFETQDGRGTLQFENKEPKKKGMLWAGYVVRWERKMGDKKVSPLVIEVK